MAETTVALRDAELTKTIEEVLAEMERLTITGEEEYHAAGNWLKRNKETQKLVKDFYEPERKATHTAYTAVTQQIKSCMVPLEKAEGTVKRKMSEYITERMRKQREEQRRLEDEARKREEERRLQEAITTGDETLLDEPVEVPIVPMEKPEEVEGISYAALWTFEIVDANAIPRDFLMPDEKKIRQYVKAMKGAGKIPGIRIYEDKTARVRL